MIPSALIGQLEQGMKDFLRVSFWSSSPGFGDMLERFLAGEDALSEGGYRESPIFRGPFVSVNLPFERGDAGPDYFADVPMDFPPYRHQQEAFERLDGPDRQNTLVATGTGSGKTETFLYPILDHCARHSGRDGIKAILIYPMNALANDQAARFARAIHGNDNLRGKVTAGLYVGQSEQVPHAGMGEDHIITDKEQLRKTPPDVLLTNYKMLDYLLARPRDQELWRHNEPESLQFLVVDELHTFDGAQGTDLGCLIRRLKDRLGTPPEHLTCVGTSATLGGGDEEERLLGFATSVFAQEFGGDAIVQEARVDRREFADVWVGANRVPDPERVEELEPANFQDVETYLERQQEIWFGDATSRVALGERLRGHPAFQNLVRLVGNEIMPLTDIVQAFARRKALGSDDEAFIRTALLSLMSLVSHARREISVAAESAESNDPEEGEAEAIEAPLVQLQIQFWQREMRRMVASVGSRPALRFYDDLTREQRKLHLPTIYCRECGLMGWATMRERDARSDATVQLKSFYQAFFKYDPRVDFLFIDDGHVDFVNQSGSGKAKHRHRTLDAANLSLHGRRFDAEEAEGEALDVVVSDNLRDTKRGERMHRHCPQCGSHDSLSLLGFQAATLTSTFINQLYASSFNDDKKVLTFSDSVQDASHRAGFFGARTWRFNLRIAIQRVLEEAAEPIPLRDLTERVVDYWRDRLGDAEFVGTFIAPDMRWLREYEVLKEEEELAKDSGLISLIRRRLSWEIHSEYSLYAPVGRSLTRTGASAATVDADRLDDAVDSLLPELQNEVGGLRELTAPRLRAFLNGLLSHLQERGAVYQPQLHEAYLKSGGKNTYVMGKRQVHMPNFSPRSRLPAFLASRSGTRRFDSLTFKTKASWYEQWLSRSFEDLAPLLAEQSDFAYELILGALCEAGVLERRTYGGTHVWGLRPSALDVTTALEPVTHDKTGQTRYVARHEVPVWEGMRSLTRGVEGNYHRTDERPNAYYADVYRDGDVRRIVAEEHTGLLDRDAREELEAEFKSDSPRPWYPNLLSCTPTLEMGIDVGDLSTAILCSVPPSQANYLQRIGRAGRRDGNALILTFAQARPHDLYFFSEPDEMIAGEVETPGIFLNASAVLERQLTAFCLDRWASSGVSEEDLPRKLGSVVGNLGKDDKGVFPYNFLHFLESYETKLLDDFLEMFSDSITETTREHLIRFMRGEDSEGSLAVRILSGLEEEQKEHRQHRRDLDRARRGLKRLEEKEHLGTTDEEEKEGLEQEKAALQRLMAARRNRPTMEFFTSEGLIPNYAFPEAGVQLRSMIWRRKSDDGGGDGSYENFYYEYERPARSAIKELAPGNQFYAGGRRVEIDRVDVDESNVEWWQFCDNCHYYEPRVATKSEYSSCPACGSAGFGDVAGQRQRMLRLRQVYANASDRASRIGDERDERSPTFYNRQMLVQFDEEETTESWSAIDDDLPFGFEYAQKTEFLDVNFGFFSDQGEKISIAGSESVRPGFRICEDCGKLQPEDEDEEGEHTYGCPSRGEEDPDVIDCLFLYRTFSSESLRFLLPFVDQPGYKRQLHSFIAALEMGLRDYYEGQVDHLETTIFEEPGPENSRRKQFLVIYDTVPGGTGYLKELLKGEGDEQPVFEVFRRARKTLTSCECTRDGDKDGCYRCLYAYRNSYDMPETSREAAVEILTALLEAEGDMEQIDWLGDINVSGLFDSALEARLVEALRRREGAEMSKVVMGQNTGYRYLLSSGDKADERVAWEIEQQKTVSKSEGVAAGAEIDMLATFSRATDAGRPIALFTDGFQYHKNRVGRDLYQRMALVQSGRYWTWSLTWKDVEHEFSDQGDFYPKMLDPQRDEYETAFMKRLIEEFHAVELRHAWNETSFDWLKTLFENSPEASEHTMRGWAGANAASIGERESLRPERFQKLSDEIREVAPPTLAEALLEGIEPGRAFLGCLKSMGSATPMRLYVLAPHGAINNRSPADIRVLGWLDDSEEAECQSGFRRSWNGFLRLYNLFQFLPRAFFVTSTSVEDLAWDRLLKTSSWWATTRDDIGAETMSDAWERAREWTLDEYRPLVDAMWQSGIRDTPEVGYELVDEDGYPTDGMAELAWPEREIAAIEIDSDDPVTEAGRDAFKDEGWTTVAIGNATEDPSILTELLEETR